jgi:hypothetical protein
MPPRSQPKPKPIDLSTWLLEVKLPAEVVKQGMECHFVKRLLKYLWRTWRVRCTAFVDNPPDEPN